MDLPGEDRVRRGLEDLSTGRIPSQSLLVSIGAPRLRRAGLKVPDSLGEADHRLYRLLAEEFGDDAQSQYHALLRQLISYERAIECADSLARKVDEGVPRADPPGSPS